jgi:Flp pilus assembly protein protease CpaA
MTDRVFAAGFSFVAVLGLGVAFQYPSGLWWFVPLIGFLAIVGVVDYRQQIIPNRLVLLTALWAVALRVHEGHWESTALVSIAVLAFYLTVNVVTRGGLGMGDVKFAAALALALGYPADIVSLVLGMWAAGLYAVWVLLKSGRHRTQLMALGPFLALGGLIGLFDILH